jgi:hypothetical protein
MAWDDDLELSMEMFDRLIRPVLPRLIRGECVRVEGRGEEIAQMLDKQIGIDALIVREDVTFALASRVQIDTGVWDTFTIRCERQSGHITELEKLKNAIKSEAMRPHLTMQAYVTNGELQSVAMSRTIDIIDYIEKNKCTERTTWDKYGWQKFKVVPWRRMYEQGYPIAIVKKAG